MAKRKTQKAEAKILNIAEVDWQLLPDHFDGAYSKLLFGPETEYGTLVDHRISIYQPKGYVARHAHKVQEQIYHVLDGG